MPHHWALGLEYEFRDGADVRPCPYILALLLEPKPENPNSKPETRNPKSTLSIDPCSSRAPVVLCRKIVCVRKRV